MTPPAENIRWVVFVLVLDPPADVSENWGIRLRRVRARWRSVLLGGVVTLIGIATLIGHVTARNMPAPATGFATSTGLTTFVALPNDSIDPSRSGGSIQLQFDMDSSRQIRWLSIKPVYVSTRWRVSGTSETGTGKTIQKVVLTENEVRSLLAKHSKTLHASRVRTRAGPGAGNSHINVDEGFDTLIERRITSFEESEVHWPGVAETFSIFLAMPWSVGGGLAMMAIGLSIVALSRQVVAWKCARCGYDLRATPLGKPCPECGNAIVPPLEVK